jgi:hypothetical protein
MNINVTVTAANILGEGPSSQPAIIGTYMHDMCTIIHCQPD